MFFKKKAFGLDISDYSIEALELDKKERVLHFGRIIIEPGIVEDGIILKKELLAQKIRELLVKSEIKTRRAILSVPESRSFIHVFYLSEDLADDNLKNELIKQVLKTIPLDLENIYWDYLEIKETNKNQKKILFVSVFKEIIDNLEQTLQIAGIEPIVIEIESIALGRALIQPKKKYSFKELKKNYLSPSPNIEASKQSYAIVDIGSRTTNISIFSINAELEFSLTIPIAGDHFTKAIATKMKISEEVAEQIKREGGLEDKFEDGRAILILQQELQVIVAKLKQLINFLEENIKEIYLVGGSALMPKITDYFSENLNIKTILGQSPIAKQLGENSLLYNTVSGLALRALEENIQQAGINLLPSEKIKKIEKQKSKILSGRFFRSHFILTFSLLLFVGVFISLCYFISNGGKQEPVKSSTPQQNQTQIATTTPELPLENQESAPIFQGTTTLVVIQETETGWLNVRSGPGREYSIIDKVYPGESYPQLKETEGWCKIDLGNSKEGWVFCTYVKKQNQ